MIFLVDISEKCLGIGLPLYLTVCRPIAKTESFLGWGCFFQTESYIFLAFYTD